VYTRFLAVDSCFVLKFETASTAKNDEKMKIAIEGCAHGELERIYDVITETEKRQNIKVDLLICCGDFQSTRNLDDLECMAVPNKFKEMCTFYK
jgi:lariat debranching enzyme